MKTRLHLILVVASLVGAALTAQSQSLLTAPVETRAQQAARESVLAMQGLRNSNLGMLRDVVARAFPADLDPQDVVDLWGTNAAGLFGLLDGHVGYMLAVATAAGDTAAQAEIAAIIAPVPLPEWRTTNEDGTVTLDIPAPEPTPTPEP